MITFLMALALAPSSFAQTITFDEWPSFDCRTVEANRREDLVHGVRSYPGTPASWGRDLTRKRLLTTLRYFQAETHPSLERHGLTLETASLEALEAAFEPVYRAMHFDIWVLESVEVALGDNPFELFFNVGRENPVHLSVVDGTVEAGGSACSEPLLPAWEGARQNSFCTALASSLQRSHPHLDYRAGLYCMNPPGRPQPNISFTSFDQNGIEIEFTQNIRRLGARYLSGKARINRKTNEVTRLRVEVVE